ncbi:hypothetical protein [Actinospica sp.]|uniref:hypothetical protein n=1 Tax=Actinospica sp. TaxID=1872142 RepID=UPI002C578BA5|nr:hypothetical protein [Actinospica sp.]HWG26660.1 hypothetical protein [Actinospica sp.]
MSVPTYPRRRTRWAVAAAATGAVALLFGTPTALAAASAPSSTTSQSAQPQVAAALYVSPTGQGTTCSLAAPCSLDQARTEVRTLAPSMSGDIDVELLGGTYQLASTFQLGPQDSGQNGHNVVYQAVSGQTPVITGAAHVTGWSEYDSSKGIYRAAVPAGTQSSQLFVNGARAQRARSALNPSGFTLSGSSFVTADSSYASFTNQSRIQIVDDNDWKQMRCPLSSITKTSSGGSSLNVSPTCFANNNTNVPNAGFPFNGSGLPALNGISRIENAYQLLTQPGQFYLDSSAGYLYYIPLSGQSMTTADVELPEQQELVDLSGTPGHLAPQLYNASGVSYSGSWAVSSGRPYGDLGNAVEYSATNGDSATFTFTGTGIQVLSETYSDEGTVDVYVDGTKTETVNASSSTRVAQQPIVDISGLSQGAHTVKLVKTGGQYLLVNAYTVTPDPVAPVHNIQFDGITFTGTTWTQPDSTGYIDNQAGVLWAPGTTTPQLIPAAVQVHRGNDVQFDNDVLDHLGGAAIDYADGTQNSTISGDQITDVSAGGVLLGEVDDYYLADTKLMTSGDVVTQNLIQHVGQDYHDAVGVWAGYTASATISNNDIGYTPYSGISLGWGWGWQSDCTLQAKQGLSTPCRHGTDYAGGNQITGNFIHSVMGILHDGGPIYTNGGQGLGTGVASAPCQQTSVLAGNIVADGNDTNNMLYQDEGSSCWNTYNNVAEFGGDDWIGMWTPTINNIDIHDNYSDNSTYNNNGTGITFNQATIATGGVWPSAAQQIMQAAGPTSGQGPATAGVTDDDSLAIAYTGTWSDSGFRGDGDYQDGVHYTSTNGDQATLTFQGTQVSFATETNSDEGTFEVLVDGVNQGTFNANASTRHAQQTLFTSQVLASGKHTITVVKESGTYLLVDDFTVK